MLVDDFDEFQCVVTAPLARLRIKTFVKQKKDIATTKSSQSKKMTMYKKIAVEIIYF